MIASSSLRGQGINELVTVDEGHGVYLEYFPLIVDRRPYDSQPGRTKRNLQRVGFVLVYPVDTDTFGVTADCVTSFFEAREYSAWSRIFLLDRGAFRERSRVARDGELSRLIVDTHDPVSYEDLCSNLDTAKVSCNLLVSELDVDACLDAARLIPVCSFGKMHALVSHARVFGETWCGMSLDQLPIPNICALTHCRADQADVDQSLQRSAHSLTRSAVLLGDLTLGRQLAAFGVVPFGDGSSQTVRDGLPLRSHESSSALLSLLIKRACTYNPSLSAIADLTFLRAPRMLSPVRTGKVSKPIRTGENLKSCPGAGQGSWGEWITWRWIRMDDTSSQLSAAMGDAELARLAATVDKRNGSETPFDVRTRSVRRRARAAMTARVTAGMSQLPESETVSIGRDRRMSVRLAWVTFVLGAVFTWVNVANFALPYLPDNTFGQVTAWLLDPMVMALVLALVRTEIRMRRQGLSVYRVFLVAKWAGLAATYAMNSVVQWGAAIANPSASTVFGVVLHSVAPIMAFAAAEVLPRIEESMTRAQADWLSKQAVTPSPRADELPLVDEQDQDQDRVDEPGADSDGERITDDGQVRGEAGEPAPADADRLFPDHSAGAVSAGGAELLDSDPAGDGRGRSVLVEPVIEQSKSRSARVVEVLESAGADFDAAARDDELAAKVRALVPWAVEQVADEFDGTLERRAGYDAVRREIRRRAKQQPEPATRRLQVVAGGEQ